MAEELIRRDEASAAVEARRQLGPEYEDQVLDAFMEKLERRLDERIKQAPEKHEPRSLVIPLSSLGLAIPLLGIAGGTRASRGF